jgi:two-component system NarL family sensor kinase
MTSLLGRFEATAPEADAREAVRAYVAWQKDRRAGGFAPDTNDDVDIRTYLLESQIAGAGRKKLAGKITALKRFYAWAKDEGLIDSSPFEEFNFDRPLLNRDQIRRRRDMFGDDPREREIARLRALNRLADELNHTTDLQATLDVTLETLVETMGLKTAWIFLWTESGLMRYLTNAPAPHDFALCAHCDLPPALIENNYYYLCDPPDCHCQHLLRHGLLTRAVNVVECTRLQDAAEAAEDTRGLLFHATVPLIARGQPLGLINVATDQWQFLSAADLQLLSAVGAQASAAIERARLFAQSAEFGAMEERNRLAREIHDTLAQGLTAITLQLETAEAHLEAANPERARKSLHQALALARTYLDEARRTMMDLRAAPLEGRTLAEALKALADEWAAKANLPVTFEAMGNGLLPLRLETGLYRVAQEALTNVSRHAQAWRVRLRLTVTPDQAQLLVEDDGRGFDPSQTPEDRYGLIGLNERVKLLGGTVKLESSPGAGTRVEVFIPL